MNKGRILIFPFGLLAHYTRCIELAKILHERFEIIFRQTPEYDFLVHSSGFQSFECQDFDPAEVLAKAEQFSFSWLNEKDLERIFKAQTEAIRRFEPVAVIGDASFGLRLAAEAAGVPYISLVNAYMSPYYQRIRRLPPNHLANTFAFFLPVMFFDGIVKCAEKIAFRKTGKPFRRIARKNGLSIRKSFLQELTGDLNLIADLPELFPMAELPHNYSVIGPLLFKNELAVEPNVFTQPERKNILITTGSSGKLDKHIFTDSLFNRYNFLMVGSQDIPVGENIRKTPFINFDEILPDTDLVICHAGNGTLYKALEYGIPVLAVTTIFEQEWNLQAIEMMKLGERLAGTAEEIFRQFQRWIPRKGSEVFDTISERIRNFDTRQAVLKSFSAL